MVCKFVSVDRHTIDIVVNRNGQLLPFTAKKGDPDPVVANFYQRAVDGEFGEIAPPDGYEFDPSGDIVPNLETANRLLSDAKAAALRKIETVADDYQRHFIGANSPDRQARFAQNLAAAKRVAAGVGTPEDIQSMTLQSEAKAAETGETPKSAVEFADWIAAWEGKTTLIAGAIEAFLVQSRTVLNALSDVSQIEPFLTQIAEQAETKFAELAGSE